MADNIQLRDVQIGVEQAWHKKTIIPADGVVTKELAFPWTPVYQPVFFPAGLNMPDVAAVLAGTNKFTMSNFHAVRKALTEASAGYVQHGKWVIPVASDDGKPLGYGNPINLDTYSVEGPGETWDFVQDILKGTKFQVVSAGTVGNRSKFFVSARLDELSKIVSNDGKEHWINFNGMGSLDKTLKKQLNVSAITICCQNTLFMDFLADHSLGALRASLDLPNLMLGVDEKMKLKWSYRHSKNMKGHVESDRPVMEQAAGLSAVVKATFDSLLKNPCSKDRAAAVYAGYITRPLGKKEEWPTELSTRAKNMVDEHAECFYTGDGNVGQTEADLLSGWTQPRTRGYKESDKEAWDTFATSEMGSYGRSKSDFAEMLAFGRDRLAEVESKGRELLKTA